MTASKHSKTARGALLKPSIPCISGQFPFQGHTKGSIVRVRTELITALHSAEVDPHAKNNARFHSPLHLVSLVPIHASLERVEA